MGELSLVKRGGGGAKAQIEGLQVSASGLTLNISGINVKPDHVFIIKTGYAGSGCVSSAYIEPSGNSYYLAQSSYSQQKGTPASISFANGTLILTNPAGTYDWSGPYMVAIIED